ncbi:MAG: hypothetical protein NUV56_02465 [Candidatus Uhrbacteria bacterium]|nr:hypothetical protein [Candidatus Uhrbacteria bacterium]
MLQAFGICEIGFGRVVNQDAMICEPERGLIVAIDGVSGCSDGKLAAEILRDTLLERCQGEPNADTLHAAFNLAHRRMMVRRTGNIRTLQACGTTLWVSPNTGHGYTGHVGDSRLIQRLSTGIVNLTIDHSTTAHLSDEEAWNHQSLLTRAVGSLDFLFTQAEVRPIALKPKVLTLAITDGLHGYALPKRIEQVVFDNDPVDKAARSAYHIGLDGQHECTHGDNITVVAARYVP